MDAQLDERKVTILKAIIKTYLETGGHMAMLVLTCLIFISASMGPAINGSLTVASVLFNIFMNLLEVLVARCV